MKTSLDIHSAVVADRPAWFRHRSVLRSYREELETAYRTYSTPAETISDLIQRIGRPVAEAIIATQVNAHNRDGRISSINRTWAAAVPDSWDMEAATRLDLLTTIHPAHINQLASEISRNVQLNPMCEGCKNEKCPGTTCSVWTGCAMRITASL